MKQNTIHWLITIVLALLVIWQFVESKCCQSEQCEYKEQRGQYTEKEHKEKVELAIFMGRLQLFADKLWWAGQAQNEALVHFYLHEMEEAMEELHEAGLVDNGVNISDLVEPYGLMAIEKMEKVALDSVSFTNGYSELIGSCNDCHKTSNYSFVKITIPEIPVFSNQDMSN
jgi:hypothetical protein